jgi:hypothetical protein
MNFIAKKMYFIVFCLWVNFYEGKYLWWIPKIKVGKCDIYSLHQNHVGLEFLETNKIHSRLFLYQGMLKDVQNSSGNLTRFYWMHSLHTCTVEFFMLPVYNVGKKERAKTFRFF